VRLGKWLALNYLIIYAVAFGIGWLWAFADTANYSSTNFGFLLGPPLLAAFVVFELSVFTVPSVLVYLLALGLVVRLRPDMSRRAAALVLCPLIAGPTWLIVAEAGYWIDWLTAVIVVVACGFAVRVDALGRGPRRAGGAAQHTARTVGD
jgi:hypothetical protein